MEPRYNKSNFYYNTFATNTVLALKKEGAELGNSAGHIFQGEFMYKNSGLVSFSVMRLPPDSL